MQNQRRTFLRAMVPLFAVAAAGCLGDDGGAEPTPTDSTGGNDDQPTATPTDAAGGSDQSTATPTGTTDSGDGHGHDHDHSATATPTETTDGTDGSGGSDGSDGSDGSGDVAVAIENFAYSPKRLAVDVGATVTWTNHDDAPHDVAGKQFNDSAEEWDFESETFGKGGKTSFTFDAPGAYEYYCTVHGKSSMCGVVVVGGGSHTAELPCE